MPKCPKCNNFQTSRRGGSCPNCFSRIEIHNDEWILADEGSPNVELVCFFEELYSERQSIIRKMNVFYRIPRRGSTWRYELVSARNLLKLADNDLSLAKEALLLIFDDSQFNWKLYSSLVAINKDFRVALAIVRAIRKDNVNKDAQQENYLNEIKSREYIFSSD